MRPQTVRVNRSARLVALNNWVLYFILFTFLSKPFPIFIPFPFPIPDPYLRILGSGFRIPDFLDAPSRAAATNCYPVVTL